MNKKLLGFLATTLLLINLAVPVYALAAAPSAPTGLTATVSAGKVYLSWVDTSGTATSFRIERCDNAGFPPKSILPIIVGSGATFTVDPTPPPNTNSFYRGFAVNVAGASGPSNVVQVTTSAIVPAGPVTPSGLTAAVVGATQVNLTWMDNSTDETGFRIQRAVNANFIDGLFGQSVGANATSFSDMAVPANQTFFYRVFAFGPAGDSAYSNVVTAATPVSGLGAPLSPSNLKASLVGGMVSLTWTNNAADATSVRVERCDNSGFPPRSILPIIVGSAQSTVTDPAPLPGTTNFFRAIAVNPSGESAPSTVVQVQVPADAGTVVSLTGLLASAALSVNNNGNAMGAAQLKDTDGDFGMSIAPGTKLMAIDGKGITALTYAEVESPPSAPGAISIYAGEAGPSGARFEPSLTAVYNYGLMKIPPGIIEDKLFVAYWNGSGWSSLVSVVDTKAKTVTASLAHFTLFALMASVPPPALPPTPSTILTEPVRDMPPPAPGTILTEPPRDATPPPPAAPAPASVPWPAIGSIVAAALVLASVLVVLRKRHAK